MTKLRFVSLGIAEEGKRRLRVSLTQLDNRGWVTGVVVVVGAAFSQVPGQHHYV